MNKLLSALQNKSLIFWVYVIASIIISFHLILLGEKYFSAPQAYSHYNNFIIFRDSFLHLIHNQDIYSLYPNEQWDLFKYSPSFALAMFPFAYLPDWLGLLLWNLFGTLLLFYAITKFPYQNRKAVLFMLWFLLLESITSMQSAQCNQLIAALIILAFTAFEHKKVQWASLFIVIAAFIKLFGGVAFLLFFFYPDKRKFFYFSILWTVLIFILPLFVISPQQLEFLYHSWYNLLNNDYSISQGLSVFGVVKLWFGAETNKMFIAFTGLMILIAPLAKVNSFKDPLFRILFLSDILIWIIIFNHKAESSTFIIAMCGVGLWYFNQSYNSIFFVLIITSFIFTTLSPTDLFPGYVRKEFLEPYHIKAIPCILIWLTINYQLMFRKYKLNFST